MVLAHSIHSTATYTNINQWLFAPEHLKVITHLVTHNRTCVQLVDPHAPTASQSNPPIVSQIHIHCMHALQHSVSGNSWECTHNYLTLAGATPNHMPTHIRRCTSRSAYANKFLPHWERRGSLYSTIGMNNTTISVALPSLQIHVHSKISLVQLFLPLIKLISANKGLFAIVASCTTPTHATHATRWGVAWEGLVHSGEWHEWVWCMRLVWPIHPCIHGFCCIHKSH